MPETTAAMEVGVADVTLDTQATAKRKSAKDEVRALLDRLPDDLTLEEIQYHLAVVVKITRSEERADREGWIPHEEFKKRFAKWLDK